MPEADGDKLWDYTTSEQALGEITFTVSSREKQKGRTVRQQLWARAVELSDASKEGRIGATCVAARELVPPKGAKPIEWRLLTNLQVTSAAQATELIDWYRARWEVDIYFHVLKNGCEVEALQLSSIDRLERALTLFMVVAWRVTCLMRKGRTCPDLDARLFFDPDKIRGAHLLIKTTCACRPIRACSRRCRPRRPR